MVRQGLVQGLAYARQRKAFGRLLIDQPLMRAVLTDLALENEANMVLMMRLAQAYERDDSPLEKAWKRVMTPAAKFWVCKRAVELTGEIMEIFGRNGYMDEGVMGRLFREAPVNSIWEGSGNVMCLDVMRAIGKEPDLAHALLQDLSQGLGDDARLVAAQQSLQAMLREPPDQLEALGRRFAERLVLLAQASLLRRHAPTAVADAFIDTRMDPQWGRVVGSIDTRLLAVDVILQRAYPN